MTVVFGCEATGLGDELLAEFPTNVVFTSRCARRTAA